MELSITPRLLFDAAVRRGWKASVVESRIGLINVELPDGRHYYIRGISSLMTSSVNVYIADQKPILNAIAERIGVTVPPYVICRDGDTDASEFLATHETVVVKPVNASHGDGVTVGVTTDEQLAEAMTYARGFSKAIIIQKHVVGDDYRVLMMGGELAAAAIREPAFVVGDGSSSVAELIKAENDGSGRGEGYGSIATRIDETSATRFLGDAGLQEVPAAGSRRRVIGTANIGKGGVAIDVTDTIDPSIVRTAKHIVDHFSIMVCGVDFIVDEKGDAYLIEINCAPSLGLHEYPFQGKARQTPDRFLDLLTAQ